MPIDMGPVTQNEMGTKCPICFAPNCDVKLSGCGHLLHWDPCCLGMMDHSVNSCPLCRAQITNWYNLRDGHWWNDA